MTWDTAITGFVSFVGALLAVYLGKKLENYATKSDVAALTLIEERTKNAATKADVAEITVLAERAKNLATKEDVREISYLSEKGKSLATREDIEALTRAVNRVEEEFSTRQLLLQSKIDLFTSRRTQMDEQRRIAWANMLDECVTVLDDRVLNAFMKTHEPETVERQLGDYEESVQRSFTKVSIAHNRVLLFTTPRSLVATRSTALSQAMYAIAKLHTNDFPRVSKDIAAATKATGNFNDHSPVLAKYIQAMKPLVRAVQTRIGEYIEAVNEALHAEEELAPVPEVSGTPKPNPDKGSNQPIPAKE